MAVNVEEISRTARVASITVSHMVVTGKRQDFVSMTIKSPAEEGWSLEEAHIAHKLVSRDAVEMAYMDCLARGHKTKNQVTNELSKRKRNYESLIKGLERKYNPETAKAEVA